MGGEGIVVLKLILPCPPWWYVLLISHDNWTRTPVHNVFAIVDVHAIDSLAVISQALSGF